MKQKDFAMVAVVAIVSGVLSIILSGMFLTPSDDRKQSVEVIQPLSADFERPSKDYFNKDSINPTKTIEIGDDSNEKPFEDQNFEEQQQE